MREHCFAAYLLPVLGAVPAGALLLLIGLAEGKAGDAGGDEAEQADHGHEFMGQGDTHQELPNTELMRRSLHRHPLRYP